MFDYRRVPSGYLIVFFCSTWLNPKVNTDEIHHVSLVPTKVAMTPETVGNMLDIDHLKPANQFFEDGSSLYLDGFAVCY